MKEFEKWISKAENDLLSIANNLNSDNIPVDICCFHAQQAAEKYLKAYLISKNKVFPKTHDLEALLYMCAGENEIFHSILPEARSLTRYAIAPRYPDIADDLTIGDAKQAFEDVLKIKQFILQYFID
jgi:HEPN domain-containing protein